MKAILEIDAPRSCIDCGLWHPFFHKSLCIVLGLDVGDYRGFRHPRCPLKIAPSCANAAKLENGKCEGYQKGEIDDEPADMCMGCRQSQFWEGAG